MLPLNVSKKYDLTRFLEAQDFNYHEALLELVQGKKKSHWMWYIFPQVLPLCISETSRFYGISSREEAESYLSHPILGLRVMECSSIVAESDKSMKEMMGEADALKLFASMTLFDHFGDGVFGEVLRKHYGGLREETTLVFLSRFGANFGFFNLQ